MSRGTTLVKPWQWLDDNFVSQFIALDQCWERLHILRRAVWTYLSFSDFIHTVFKSALFQMEPISILFFFLATVSWRSLSMSNDSLNILCNLQFKNGSVVHRTCAPATRLSKIPILVFVCCGMIVWNSHKASMDAKVNRQKVKYESTVKSRKLLSLAR